MISGSPTPPDTVETQVSIGIEYAQAMDFEVYALTHSDLAVDYRFKADGDGTATNYPQTVDAATGNRMALVTNGSNGTGTAYPRPIWSARYTANNSVLLERRYSGQDWPAWIQGIDFSSIVSTGAVSGGDPPNLVTTANGYQPAARPGHDRHLPGKDCQCRATAGDQQHRFGNLRAQSSVQATAAVLTEVRTLGLPTFTDAAGAPVSGTPSYTLDGDGGPVYVQVVDKDRNTNATTIRIHYR